ncbi:hypothetical protein [Allohahella sp. A8]|uniref:hypothetical protein n=1 Tax=Allohahella sp. A8 TaxID=3141461 RepID=UPI003A807B13
MANDEETSDYPERLLGRMLAEASRAKAGSVPESSRPDDAAILELYEQLSDPSTSAAQRAEAMAVLMRDSEAYARWLALTRFMEKHAEQPLLRKQTVARPVQRSKASREHGVAQKLQRLLSSFWYNPALSAAFGLLLGVLVTSFYAGTSPGSDDHGPILAQQGVPLPHKASQQTSGAATAPATSADDRIGQSIRCVETSAMLEGRLCYSATSPDQQWFQISDTDQVRALLPPVNTDRIVDVVSVGDLLLIEHQHAEEYQLSLLRLNDGPEGMKVTLLHEATAADGYFDEVALDGDDLTYVLHLDGKADKRRFAIP